MRDNLLVDHGLERTHRLRLLLVHPDTHKPYNGRAVLDAPLFKLSDTDFIEELDKAFEPEFESLKKAEATVERGSAPVLGGYGEAKDLSPSQLLYGKDHAHVEIDRTVVGILALRWIMLSKYETFSHYQAPPIRIQESDFVKLTELFLDTLKTSSHVYMLIIAMIVNDLGKDKSWADKIPDGESGMNHDAIIWECARQGKIDLVQEPTEEARLRLLKGIELGAKMNCAQLAQAENVPGSLQDTARIMKGDEHAFDMKFLEVVLDVAGANGHVDSRCAKGWISPVNQAYINARRCLLKVINGKGTLHECYDGILTQRADLLSKAGFKELKSTIPEQRALLRLCTIGRVANKHTAQLFDKAFNSLPRRTLRETTAPKFFDLWGNPVENVYKALVDGLSVDGIGDGIAIIPYYAPGAFAELTRLFHAERDEMRIERTAALMRFMARLFIGTRPISDAPKTAIVDGNMDFVVDVLRSAEFKNDPKVLDKVTLPQVMDKENRLVDKEIWGREIAVLMEEAYGIIPTSVEKSAT